MAEILYHREGLFGPNLELHIAPEGLTLVGRGGVGSVEYAPISDIVSVSLAGGGRRSELWISFGKTRPAWTLKGLQTPVAQWAEALINEEITATQKSENPDFNTALPISDLTSKCEQIAAKADGRAAVDVVDFLLVQAVLHEASDVHFEPFNAAEVVRFRLDGVLQDVASINTGLKRQLTSRLKVVSRLATFKDSVAQEGRAAMKVGDRTVDFRFSSIPTIYGEKVTVRIFDPVKSIFEIDSLGMNQETLGAFQKLLMQPQGMILLTGPASSGKTTTMYASLGYLRRNKKNLSSIATVEDPVEYDLQVVNQTQVNNTSGLTFANALRTVLRQDPEVIMIGEIRDRETADTATQAGLTGHMVLSSVHARSAVGVLLRLVDLGVEPFLVASSVTAMIAQRLVRVVCPDCARDYEPTSEEIAKFGLNSSERFKIGAGCPQCSGSGYSGRTGIFQLVPISDTVREMLLKHSSLHSLESQIEHEQIRSLRQDGLEKARAGITTLEELTRVLG